MRYVFLLLLTVPALGMSQGHVSLVKWPRLEQRLLSAGTDTLWVVNYWSTWCKPCVEELPHFEALSSALEGKGRPIRVLLVSSDDPTTANTKVKAFARKKALNSDVVVLDHTDPNDWIDRVNPQWQGNLPATQLWLGGKPVAFASRSFSARELHDFVLPFVTP